MKNIEDVILQNMFLNETYARKIFPYLKDEYFDTEYEKLIFDTIKHYIDNYDSIPTADALKIGIQTSKNSEIIKKANTLIDEYVEDYQEQNLEWLLDETEKFCKDKALYNALKESISIAEGSDKINDKGSIPEILTKALSVGFDNNIGHDYFEDAEKRWEYYNKKDIKYPCDLDYLNLITKDGVSTKTLNVILGGTNVGKTLILCHLAASYLHNGYDVCYITMEIAEEEISKRIDANLYDLDFDSLLELPKSVYLKRIEKLKSKIHGRLFVKEYPNASANVTNFRALLNELYLKKKFRPQILIVDYLNICTSSRIKMNSGMYLYVKSIAEELRGLAVEYKLALWSASQLNRAGFNSSEPDLTNTSESFGLPATADFMFVVVTNEELEALDQYMCIQLKNRYTNVTKNKRFIIGVDRSKMKLYNVESTAQTLAKDLNEEQVVNKEDIKTKEKSERFKSFRFG